MSKINYKYYLSIVLLCVLIVGLYVFFRGNPIIKMRINKESDNYVAENYPQIRKQVNKTNSPYFRQSPEGNFWYVYYESQNDTLCRFKLLYDRSGNLVYDGCSDNYLKGGCIYEYYSEEFRTFVLKAFDDVYHHGIPVAGISINTATGDESAEAGFNNIAEIRIGSYTGPQLDIHKEYTISELSEQFGYINFTFRKDDKTIDSLYRRCIEARSIIEQYDIAFNTISITFDLTSGVFELSRDDLFSDNLLEILSTKSSL